MLIRSQNKRSLFNLNNITKLTVGKVYGLTETDWIIEADKVPFRESLGQYSSEEKVMIVLGMIEERYNNLEMMKLEGTKKYFINFVFEMPQDEDVIV